MHLLWRMPSSSTNQTGDRTGPYEIHAQYSLPWQKKASITIEGDGIADRVLWEGDFDEDKDDFARYFKNPQRYLRRPICGCTTTNRRQVTVSKSRHHPRLFCWQPEEALFRPGGWRSRGGTNCEEQEFVFCISNGTLGRRWLSPVKNQMWWFFTWKANDAHEGRLVSKVLNEG